MLGYCQTFSPWSYKSVSMSAKGSARVWVSLVSTTTTHYFHNKKMKKIYLFIHCSAADLTYESRKLYKCCSDSLTLQCSDTHRCLWPHAGPFRQWFSAWVPSLESLVEIRFSALASDLVIQNLHFQLPFPQAIHMHIKVWGAPVKEPPFTSSQIKVAVTISPSHGGSSWDSDGSIYSTISGPHSQSLRDGDLIPPPLCWFQEQSAAPHPHPVILPLL